TILLVISLTSVTLVAVMTGALTTFGSRNVLMDGYRAWHLAESGEAWVHASLLANPGSNPQAGVSRKPILTMGDDNAIFVQSYSRQDGVLPVRCIGIANYNEPGEIRREMWFWITPPPPPNQMLPAGFDYDGDGQLDADTWSLQGVANPAILDGPGQRDALALELSQSESALDLTWQSNPELDLAAAWANNEQLLAYEAQLKVGYFDDGVTAIEPTHYMVGFTFRQSPDDENAYGLSFFQSRAVDPMGIPLAAPAWLPAGFGSLRGTDVHLVAWSREGGVITLLNHRALTLAEGLVVAGTTGNVLNPYSAMLLEMTERVGPSGRENAIRAYLANPGVYPDTPSVNDVAWAGEPAVFPSPVQWSNPVTSEVVDGRLTSENFGATPGQEISIHFFRGEEEGAFRVILDDFALRAEGYRNPASAIRQY
ncbi:MAG: hypothetical protein ACI9TH_005027, partial [Kiritimatiellia bacterium]